MMKRNSRANAYTAEQRALSKIVNNCRLNGHAWQPTLTNGVMVCQHCKQLGACRICAPLGPNMDVWGLCRVHQGQAVEVRS